MRPNIEKSIGWIALALLVFALVNCRPAAAPPAQAPSSTPNPTETPMAPIEVTPAPSPAPTVSNAPASGLHITATIGPTCPGPERPGQVCTRPYAGEFVITTKDGKEIARVTTDTEGKATIDLPPGDYTLTPKLDPNSPYPRGGPIEATVTKGVYVDVVIALDTGIR